MPYVTIQAFSRKNLRDSAERRWQAIRETRPDLEPALALQRDLLTRTIDLAETLGSSRLPRLSLPPKYLAAKLTRGVPALAGEPIPLPVPVLTPVLFQLCEALARGGAGDAATHIRQELESGKLEAGSLLTASLHRDQGALRTGAVHRGLSPDLMWLIAELAVSPFAHALQRMLFGAVAAGELREALDAWNHGYCPACGSWPAVGEVAAGHRTLRCSFCSCAWELNTYACIYCENSGEGFVTAAPDAERKDRRIEVCSGCGGYLKTIDLPELSPFPLLSISDIETTDLDVAAMEHGYARPGMKEFTKKK
ncbi:MAG TPA: formate dehydrogenase accessory protein FdhE [Vicinamibacterales bacterium]|nr:formate dehydrogenase accessory protein FdhE [Vicinamibacterales bacterium]